MKDSIIESSIALDWAKGNLMKQKQHDETRGRNSMATIEAETLLTRAQEYHDTLCEEYIYKRFD